MLIQFEVPAGTAWSAQAEPVQPILDREAARGLRARVQGQGFLGAGILALEYVDPKLYPIEPVPWTPKHYYIPSAPSQFNHLLGSLEQSLYHVQDLDFSALLSRAQTLIDAGTHLAGNLDHVDFNQIGTNADSLIVEFRESNRGLQRTLADAQNAINGADVPALSRQTAALEAKLSATALQLHQLLAGVDMSSLDGSLVNVRIATDQLIRLLHDLQQRPSSILFSKYPQPDSGMEKPPRK